MESYDRIHSESSNRLTQFVRVSSELGYSVFPVAPNAKTPALPWSTYQHRQPTADELSKWFTPPALFNVGIVTGDISRLIVIDCDSPASYESICNYFPELQDCFTVETRRGQHIYCRIPDSSAPPSINASGLDLQSTGRYVVGPGSIVDGHCYTVSNPAPPLELSAERISQVVYFIAQRAVCRTWTPEVSPAATGEQWQASDAQNYYAALAAQGSRNPALFATAIAARDRGMSPDWTFKALARTHAHARAAGEHRNESEAQRLNEARRTIASAYSRPPRPTGHQGFQDQIPTAARQELNRRKLTAVWRFTQAARARGIRPGDKFSYSDVLRLLAGTVGDWSIRIALDSSCGVFSPLTTPHTANAVAIKTGCSQKNHADFLGGKNQRKLKIRPAHRPPTLYKMPTNAAIMRALGLERLTSRIIDPVPIETLIGKSGAKNGRLAMHRAYLQARPTYKGAPHRLFFLRKRLGVCARTLKRYNLELGLTPTLFYEETPLFWTNVDLLAAYCDPDSGLSLKQGHFIADETGKRYPPLPTIAAHLLKAGHFVSLFKQRETRWNYEALRQQPTAPAPKSEQTIAQNRSYAPETEFSALPCPASREEALSDQLPATAPAQRSDNAEPRATALFAPPTMSRKAREQSYKRPLKSERAESLAQSIYSQIHGLSLIRAREIAATNPPHLIQHAIKIIQRRGDAIRNPAGFLVTFIRSAHERPKTSTTPEDHQAWVDRLRQSPYADYYTNSEHFRPSEES